MSFSESICFVNSIRIGLNSICFRYSANSFMLEIANGRSIGSSVCVYRGFVFSTEFNEFPQSAIFAKFAIVIETITIKQ